MKRPRLISTLLPADPSRTAAVGVPMLEPDPDHADSFRARTVDHHGRTSVVSMRRDAPIASVRSSALHAMSTFATRRVVVRVDALYAYK